MSAVLIRVAPSAADALTATQRQWRLTATPGLEYAIFGGQQMALLPDETRPGTFRLEYLGFTAVGYASAAAAKEVADEFALTVLRRLFVLVNSRVMS